MRKMKLVTAALGLICAALLSFPPTGEAQISAKAVGSDKLIPIIIYHTNDIHGQIGPSPENKKWNLPASGGAASLATVLKSESDQHLYFDSGDWYQGTPVGNLTKGKAVVSVLNALGLDGAVLGNHEFDYGTGVVADLISQARFPVLGSNVSSRGTEKTDTGTPFVMLGHKGLKIGLLGLLTHNMQDLLKPENIEGLEFQNPVSAARDSAGVLRRAGADVVIALSHMGIEAYGDRRYGDRPGDIAVARSVAGIDAILGGHTHTPMKEAVVVRGPDGKGTIITQTGGKLREVFRIVLYYNPATKQVDKFEAKPISLDPSAYPPDPAMESLLAGFNRDIDTRMAVPVGYASVEMPRNPFGESLLHNWVTDAFKSYAGTDIGVTNAFGLRADLKQGEIKYGDVYRILPFDNDLLVFRMTGAELRKAIAASLPSRKDRAAGVHFSAGVAVRFDPNQPPGKELISVELNGEPLNDARVYSIAADDFTATVSRDFKARQKVSLNNTHVLTREVLLEAVRKNPAITSALEGRLTAVSAANPG